MCLITAIGSFFSLSIVINMLIAVGVLVQGIGQVVALITLRRRRPNLNRPYRMWLYPIPGILALFGWAYVYYSSGWSSIWMSLVWVAVGIVAYLIWARIERIWPFGPNEIQDAFLEQPNSTDVSA
jgi:amino acid transporter